MAEGEENSWGIIDILTLLLVFFIILYVNEMGKNQTVALPAEEKAVYQENSFADPVPVRPERVERAEVVPSPALISPYFSDLQQEGLGLAGNAREFTLTLEERLAFAGGRADLLAETLPILDRLANLLAREQGYQVIISGHTDDLPINNGEFRSNWHLSTGRAVAVAEYLLFAGLAPERVVTQGYAEFRPRFANDTPENRARNRRVEVTLRNDSPFPAP